MLAEPSLTLRRHSRGLIGSRGCGFGQRPSVCGTSGSSADRCFVGIAKRYGLSRRVISDLPVTFDSFIMFLHGILSDALGFVLVTVAKRTGLAFYCGSPPDCTGIGLFHERPTRQRLRPQLGSECKMGDYLCLHDAVYELTTSDSQCFAMALVF